ncbi:putative nuclease HARBI1 [Gigantopelta aegis]|uniref:putative nuclease HARBI1 n=1 Tax=Gigantopelta aegis TaxID=1735272 RepID=UPI001B88A98C|nr:putative nuclease HARBI1 [Gigantopelta aegis]
MREPLEPALLLAITLRYLANGNSYKTLEYEFRVANNTISRIVPETRNAINNEFAEEFLKCPSTPDEWRAVAEGFSNKWNFYNCLGALDGKHVVIRAPSASGSVYYNYKGFHSIGLMALVDSQYRFLYVEVGANGGASDGGVFAGTPLWAALENNTLGVPPPTPFPRDDQPMPYSIVADDAFAMRTYLMKPYPQRGMSREQRLYNYGLSRARRVVENAFGILAYRFRFLLAPMAQRTENVETIVLAACVIHNIPRTRFPRIIDGIHEN